MGTPVARGSNNSLHARSGVFQRALAGPSAAAAAAAVAREAGAETQAAISGGGLGYYERVGQGGASVGLPIPCAPRLPRSSSFSVAAPHPARTSRPRPHQPRCVTDFSQCFPAARSSGLQFCASANWLINKDKTKQTNKAANMVCSIQDDIVSRRPGKPKTYVSFLIFSTLSLSLFLSGDSVFLIATQSRALSSRLLSVYLNPTTIHYSKRESAYTLRPGRSP